jgi:uncharacterized protein (TIGR02996 family)
MDAEREAFLAAIFADPEDDTPRLVYADWLEENAEGEYAEFIRLQCEYLTWDFGSPERDDCESRMNLAWESMRTALRTEFPEIDDQELIQYRRGFLEDYLDVTVIDYLSRANRWWPRMPVRKIRTRIDSLNVRSFAECAEVQRLEELAIKGIDPHGSVIPKLCRSKHLRKLQVLDLSEYTLGIEAAEALDPDSFPELKELRLPFNLRPNREAGKLLRKRFGDRARF